MACAKCRADSVSSFRSFLVLRLVSMAVTMERGSSDCRSKTEIFCSVPSSIILKSSLFSEPTGAPFASVTVTNMFTSLTSTLTVPSGSSWARQALESSKTSRRRRTRTSVRCLVWTLCRLRFGADDRRGKGLAISPDRAVDKELLLPNRNGALESVDEPAAGIESRTPVSRRHSNKNAGFANLQATQSMDQSYIPDLKVGQGLKSKFLHLLERHGFVGFVVEVESLAASSVVADDALEDRSRAIFGTLQDIGDSHAVNWFANDGAMQAAGQYIGSARDRRKKGDLIPRLKCIRRPRKFLVDRHGNAWQMLLEFRRFDCVMIDEIRKGRPLGQIRRVGGETSHVLEDAEEKNADLHGCYSAAPARNDCFANRNRIANAMVAPAMISQRPPLDSRGSRVKRGAINPPSTSPVKRPPTWAELLIPVTAAP